MRFKFEIRDPFFYFNRYIFLFFSYYILHYNLWYGWSLCNCCTDDKFRGGTSGSMLTIAESSPEAPLAANSYIEHDPISLIGDDQVDSFFAGNGTDGLSWESAHRLENLNISDIDIESAICDIFRKHQSIYDY